jgi:hypothetical protein
MGEEPPEHNEKLALGVQRTGLLRGVASFSGTHMTHMTHATHVTHVTHVTHGLPGLMERPTPN